MRSFKTRHNVASAEPEKKEGFEVKEPEVTPELLLKQLSYFQRLHMCATSRKLRCEELMNRRSASKLSPDKTSRLVRKLNTAKSEISQATQALSTIQARFEEFSKSVQQ